MGNKSPEIEFINLQHLAQKKEHCQGRPALESLKKLANSALMKGPFSVTFEKQDPHIAASGDPKDFLSLPILLFRYWWPVNIILWY